MHELEHSWTFDDADQAHVVLDALDEHQQRVEKRAKREAKRSKR